MHCSPPGSSVSCWPLVILYIHLYNYIFCDSPSLSSVKCNMQDMAGPMKSILVSKSIFISPKSLWEALFKLMISSYKVLGLSYPLGEFAFPLFQWTECLYFLKTHMVNPEVPMWLYFEIDSGRISWKLSEIIRVGPWSDKMSVLRRRDTRELSFSLFFEENEKAVFPKRVLGKLHSYMQKNQTGPLSHITYKN